MATIVFLLLSGLIIAHEAIRTRVATYDALFFFNVSFLVYFGLAPLHLLLGGSEFAGLPNVYRDYFEGDQDSQRQLLNSALLILAVYGCVLLGYYRSFRRHRFVRLEPIDAYRIRAAIGLCAFIGMASLILYVVQFSDPLAPFLRAALIRSGVEKTEASLMFLRNLSPLVGSAAVLTLAVWLDRAAGNRRAKGQLVLFLLLLVLGALAVLTQGSRRAWLIYAVEFYLVVANYRQRIYAAWGAVLAVMGLVVIVLGDLLALALGGGGQQSAGSDVASVLTDTGLLYAVIWRDFTLPYLEMIAVVDRYEGLPRLLLDIPHALLQLVPERLLPIELPPPLAAEMTLLITGIPVSVIAEVPPGFVGFFWVSGYLPGVILCSLLFGVVGRALDEFFLEAAHRQAVVMVLYTWFSFAWAYFMREGVPYMLLIERFQWFVAGGILLALCRVRFGNTPRAATFVAPAMKGTDAR
jgi:hypothetical protein